MANELVYEVSEYTLGLPVGVAEVDALLSLRGRPIAKDLDKLTHFLRRVRHTIDSSTMDLAAMRRRVDELLVANNQPRGSGPANPAQALKFASPEEIEEVVDRLSKDRLVALRRMIDTASDQYEKLLSVSQAVETLVDKAESDADISPEVAQAIRDALSVQVSVPTGLEQDPDGSDSGWRPHPAVAATPSKATTGNTHPPTTDSATANPPTFNIFDTGTEDTGTEDTGTVDSDTVVAEGWSDGEELEATAVTNTSVEAHEESRPLASTGQTKNAATVKEDISAEDLNAPAPSFDIAETPTFPVTSPFTQPLGGWASSVKSSNSEPDPAPTGNAQEAEVDLSELFDGELFDEEEVDFDAIFKDEA